MANLEWGTQLTSNPSIFSQIDYLLSRIITTSYLKNNFTLTWKSLKHFIMIHYFKEVLMVNLM